MSGEERKVHNSLVEPGESVGKEKPSNKCKQKKEREFDWSKAAFAHFVLKLSYVGTDYHGNAFQEPSIAPTVEAELFEALTKTKLVRDQQSCHFSRCGRTDKGVHAAGNYISLRLRLKPSKAKPETAVDYDYVSMLNGVLPSNIRILAAARAPSEEFDARFSCLYRIYRYYFPLDGEDIDRMNTAAQLMLGEHDFRNFCKMDIEHVSHFRRQILYIRVEERPTVIGEVCVVGTAFLWHQVRCIVAVLLLVGQKLEEPGIVAELLDIEKHPRKPLYEPADESGLVLYDCGFEGVPFAPGRWPDAGVAKGTSAELMAPELAFPSSCAARHGFEQMRAQALRQVAVYACLSGAADPTVPLTTPSRPGHTPLLQRAVQPSFEEKQAAFEAKRRRKEGGASGQANSAEPIEG